jgi:hypothetical protein
MVKCRACRIGEMKYYHGWLGYESMQCNRCHHDINDVLPKVKGNKYIRHSVRYITKGAKK